MEVNKIYNESCIDTLARMPDNFLDCVITSPPYYQLRDYGYDGQWGLEPTMEGYLEHLWMMMSEVYRVLKPQGTVWVNLGDSYSNKHNGSIKQKCLLLVPHRFAIGCIDIGFVMRNDIVWAKPNGLPESVTDRFTKKHEYFFFMVKSSEYYFDLDAIRDKHKQASIDRQNRGTSETNKWINGASGQSPHSLSQPRKNVKKGGTPPLILRGKNPGDVSDFWDISRKASPVNHYAPYNDELIKKPILAGCPEGGIIYDPFMGTGTTAEAAIRSGRKFIGSEMSGEYCDITNKRLEPFLTQQNLF